jgi:hypothetical protein
MVNKFLVFIVCVILGCNSESCNTEEKLNLLKTSEGKPYYWQPDVFPLTILVPSNTSKFMYDKLLQAAEELNLRVNCTVLDIQIRPESELVFSGFQDYREYGKVVFKVQDVREDRLAETEVFLQPGLQGEEGIIKFAEIRIPENTKDRVKYEIMHELMHTVGIGHDLNKDSIMYIAVHDSEYKIEDIDLKYMQNICKGIVSTELDKE